MSDAHESCPATYAKVVEDYFLEHRAKVIDVAAFLDRLDRARDRPDADDFRVTALRHAIRLLDDGEPARAQRILEHLSDPTSAPIPEAPMQGALGAPAPVDGAS